MASSGYGVLHRLSWEGRFDRDLTTHLKHIPVANDMLADSKGENSSRVVWLLGALCVCCLQ